MQNTSLTSTLVLINCITTYFCHSSEQEHDRMTSSSNVDDRTQHEIYAQPFLRSVMAGVASVMCSYSKSPHIQHIFDTLLSHRSSQ